MHYLFKEKEGAREEEKQNVIELRTEPNKKLQWALNIQELCICGFNQLKFQNFEPMVH